MFLRHEGFLGALGAFMSYEKHGLDYLRAYQLVERFSMEAPCIGGKIHGPPLDNLNEKARTLFPLYSTHLLELLHFLSSHCFHLSPYYLSDL